MDAGLSPLQARIVAGRVRELGEAPGRIVRPRLAQLHDPSLLADAERAATRLARAVRSREVVGIVTDYDVDGITSHAIVFHALTAHFGLPVGGIQHHIGHRLTDGYGLSPSLTDRILSLDRHPQLLITADCGTSDHEQIERLTQAGIDVIVTDHHGIPERGIPETAAAVVNPSRRDCDFPDATIAGCMVSWLLMCEVRRRLVETGDLAPDAPRLGNLLDLVALGTVADAVSLFGSTNRAVVMAGLGLMNRLQRPAWRAMARLLGRTSGFSYDDLGFQLGPRINARGRMADPAAALRFLLARNDTEARAHLDVLDADNQDRREVEKRMLTVALEQAKAQVSDGRRMLVVCDSDFHAGVQGIVASRLAERFGLPAIVLSPGRTAGELTGSARSVAGLDIRRALEALDAEAPGLLKKFGGHSAAAGLTLADRDRPEFHHRLDVWVKGCLPESGFGPRLYTDGTLGAHELTRTTVAQLDALAPFGREFDAPVFEGEFGVAGVRRVGQDGIHLSLNLHHGAHELRAIWFRALETAASPDPVREGQILRFVYRLERDDYRGGDAVQLNVQAVRRSRRDVAAAV